MFRKFLHVLPLLLLLVSSPCWAQTAGWEFPTAASVTVSSSDNGKILASDNTPGTFVTVTLANPSALPTGWEMGFSTANGHGIIVNAPNSVYIFAGQKQLTSFSAPSNTNYEFFTIQSDGTNYRLLTSTATTTLFNGLIGAPAGKLWTYLFSTGYTATLADNGTTLTSALTGGATTITLPSTGLIPNGWAIGLYANGQPITLNLNGVSGGSLITPNGGSVTSYVLPGTPTSYALLSFDGASFRVLLTSGGTTTFAVDNISQLAALGAVTNNTTVTTRGHYTPGDGGGATYTFSTSNCVAADDGAQVQPLTGTGCFLITPQDYYDWRIWGVKTEGTLGYHATPIDPAGTFDSTTFANAALASGLNILIGAGQYHITNTLFCGGYGQVITGVGRTQSVIDVGSDMNLSASAELIAGNSGANFQTGCEVHKVGFQFYQNTADTVRSQLIKYPWAISCTGQCGRIVLDQVRVSLGWDCINLPNNSGGWWWGRLELGCFDQGIEADGTLDFSHVDSIESWSYGVNGNANLLNIYCDGNTQAATLGSVQGFQISKYSVFCGNITVTANNSPSEGIMIDQLHTDDITHVTINGGRVQFGDLYLGVSSLTTSPSLTVAGVYQTTRVTVGNLNLNCGPTVGCVLVTGGVLVINGGSVYSGPFSGGIDAPLFTVTDTTAGSMLKMTGVYLRPKNNANLTQPVVWLTGGISSQLVMDGDTFEDGAGFTGTMIKLDHDNLNNHIANISGLNTWGNNAVSLGFTPSIGYYDFGNYPFTLTPTLSFATNGDYAPTGSCSGAPCFVGQYYLRGNYVEMLLNAQWTNNAYTTASGAFQINTNLPPAPVSFPSPGEPLIVSGLNGASYSASPAQFPCNGWINGASVIALGLCVNGLSSAAMNTANLPASRAYQVTISGRYTIH